MQRCCGVDVALLSPDDCYCYCLLGLDHLPVLLLDPSLAIALINVGDICIYKLIPFLFFLSDHEVF